MFKSQLCIVITYLFFHNVIAQSPEPLPINVTSPATLNTTFPTPPPQQPQPLGTNTTIPTPQPLGTNTTIPTSQPYINASIPQPFSNQSPNDTVPQPFSNQSPNDTAPQYSNASIPQPFSNQSPNDTAPQYSNASFPQPFSNQSPNDTAPQPLWNDTVPQPVAPPEIAPEVLPFPPAPRVTNFVFYEYHAQYTGIPTGRSSAIMGITANGKTVVILGGNSQGSPKTDNWKFEINKNIWTKFTDANFSSRSFACSHQAMDKDTVWVYGGKNVMGNETKSLVQYHIHDNTLKEYKEPQGSAALDVACAVHNNNDDFYVFGGVNTVAGRPNCSDELWKFTDRSGQWFRIMPNNTGPSPRRGSVASIRSRVIRHEDEPDIHEDYFIIFGGSCGNQTFNETWRYHIQNNKWYLDHSTGAVPSARTYSSGDIDNNNFYIFGGVGSSGIPPIDQFYVYNVDNQVWAKLSSPKSPAPRARLSLAKSLNRIVVYGGENNLRDYDDIWQFVIEQNCFVLPCDECVNNKDNGCGWCQTNDYQFQCVAATEESGAFLPQTCLSEVIFDVNECPTEPFPEWAVGVIVVLAVVAIAFIMFVIVKYRSKVIEQIK